MERRVEIIKKILVDYSEILAIFIDKKLEEQEIREAFESVGEES